MQMSNFILCVSKFNVLSDQWVKFSQSVGPNHSILSLLSGQKVRFLWKYNYNKSLRFQRENRYIRQSVTLLLSKLEQFKKVVLKTLCILFDCFWNGNLQLIQSSLLFFNIASISNVFFLQFEWHFHYFYSFRLLSLTDPRGRCQVRKPPSKFIHFHALSTKILPNNRFCPKPSGWRASSPSGKSLITHN